MITREAFERAVARATSMLERAGVALGPEERGSIEVADFGLSDLERTGLEILVYVNNERYCAKELVLFPGQACPEHLHPPFESDPGKMETFRCRWGEVTVRAGGQAIVLHPGMQFTIPPGTVHSFSAGPEGAVISEFSSASRDEFDVFPDNRIRRVTVIEGRRP